MALLSARGIAKAYADKPILTNCNIAVSAGERIGLVGRNGCGKSTLLRILGGVEDRDFGTLEVKGSLSILHQNAPLPGSTVGEAADLALAWHGELLQQYDQALAADELDRAAELQERLDHVGWELSHTIDSLLHQLKAPPRPARIDRLSGGEKRRVSLARALLGSPDLLLLDEPTNHLDAETIEWFEGMLASYKGGIIVVSHDRYLLEAVTNRMVEIDHGETVNYEGSYADYLVERAERRALLHQQQDSRLSMIAREAAWASRSPSARSTKQRARLKRLEELRGVAKIGKDPIFSLDLKTGWKKGSTIVELHDVSKSYGERTILSKFDSTVRPRDRIGILGENGSGKTTLINLFAGKLEPDSGTRNVASRVKVAMLDQERTGLSATHSVYEAAGDGGDHVRIGDHSIHVASFLNRFLFDRAMFDQHVGSLSGGERARLLLAKLLLQGAQLLLLDEPTNDLDLMTIRVLEEALLSFDGAVILVTHDRALLDRCCNRILVFGDDGEVMEFASRIQAVEHQKRQQGQRKKSTPSSPPTQTSEQEPSTPAAKRLTFKEQKELKNLPALLEELERQKDELETLLADPSTYQERTNEVPEINQKLAALNKSLEAHMERWVALEERL